MMRDYPEVYTPLDEGESNLPLLLGLGLAAGAVILLTSKGSAQQPPSPVPGQIRITSGISNCSGSGSPGVVLNWTSGTNDQDFDVLRDNVTVDTVRGNKWTSYSGPDAISDKQYSYQVIGVQSKIKSNTVQVTITRCAGGPPPPTQQTVTVQAGDSLSSIAAQLGLTWQQLYCYNQNEIGADPNLILPGQVLRVPPSSYQATCTIMPLPPPPPNPQQEPVITNLTATFS